MGSEMCIRDSGKPSHFIVLGILFTTLFVLVLLGIANLAMHLAGV
mgnify:CR=1 FL=1